MTVWKVWVEGLGSEETAYEDEDDPNRYSSPRERIEFFAAKRALNGDRQLVDGEVVCVRTPSGELFRGQVSIRCETVIEVKKVHDND